MLRLTLPATGESNSPQKRAPINEAANNSGLMPIVSPILIIASPMVLTVPNAVPIESATKAVNSGAKMRNVLGLSNFIP